MNASGKTKFFSATENLTRRYFFCTVNPYDNAVAEFFVRNGYADINLCKNFFQSFFGGEFFFVYVFRGGGFIRSRYGNFGCGNIFYPERLSTDPEIENLIRHFTVAMNALSKLSKPLQTPYSKLPSPAVIRKSSQF